MVRWLKEKFGADAVPWVFLCAAIGLPVAGIVGTVVFAVSGIMVGLNLSVPVIVVGGLGVLVTGGILEGKGYL